MHIALIAKPGHTHTGVGRYVQELERHLRAQAHQVTVVHPKIPLPKGLISLGGRLGWDLQAFFNNYPLWARYPEADIYHITSQNLATLMHLSRPPGKTVITVHDLIPWLTRNDPELSVYGHPFTALFDRLTLWGLKKADSLLSDSSFTTQTIVTTLNIPAGQVNTVFLGRH
jgi:glycosyltransferase involved in cell wall biosynthesis